MSYFLERLRNKCNLEEVFCPPGPLRTLIILPLGLYSLAQKPIGKAFGKTLTLVFV